MPFVVSLAASRVDHRDHDAPDSGSDLADAIRRVLEIEFLFALAQYPREGERCFFELVLAARAVGDAEIQVAQLTPRICDARLGSP